VVELGNFLTFPGPPVVPALEVGVLSFVPIDPLIGFLIPGGVCYI
jgi:hypothetical protein